MKEIKAVVDPGMLHRVMDALHALPHFPGVTVSDAQGQGRGEGAGGKYVPGGNALAFTRQMKLEIFCTDQECDQIVDAIRKAAHVGQAGRGIIRVLSLERVLRVSTSEENDNAV